MQLLAAWKDSLTLLWPKNFKLVAGATLLALIRTYRVWLGAWWWLITLLVTMYGLYGPHVLIILHGVNVFNIPSLVGFPFFIVTYTGTVSQEEIIQAISLVFFITLVFTMYLSARPSVLPKNHDYFLGYARHFLLFLGWFLSVRIFVFFMLVFSALTLTIPVLPYYLVGLVFSIVWVLYAVSAVVCSAMPALCVFFFLDSSGSLMDMFRSLVNSMKMTLFNLPLLSVVVGIAFGGMTLLSSVCTFFLAWFVTPRIALSILSGVYLLVLPIPITMLCVMYVKRLYDNSAIYLE